MNLQDHQPEHGFIDKRDAAQIIPAGFLTTVNDATDRQLLDGALRALKRGPTRYSRDNVIVCEGDPTDFMFLVVSGTVRACRSYETGARSIVAFYLPGDLLGWTNTSEHPTSVEAATDAIVVFLKRSVLMSIATQEIVVANSLLTATTKELRRTQEHAILKSRSAKCRVATFLTDLWKRLGNANNLDLPMSHRDIADYLGLSMETLSRTLTDMERSGILRRVTCRRLTLENRPALELLMN